MKTILALSSLALLSLSSCSDDSHYDVSTTTNNKNYRQEETSFKIIHFFDNDITVLDSSGFYKFHDDIWIPKEYLNDDTPVKSTRGAAILGRSWPDNKVYFTTEDIPTEYVANIYKAISIVEKHSYIDFIPTKGGAGFLKFNYTNSDKWDAHSDYLGMRKGKTQNIVLSTGAIQDIGVIVHEICHVIGMDHEQNRSDRDNYLSIDFNKMPNQKIRYQYTKYADKRLIGKDIGDFDFESIMLYSSDEYMKKKDGSSFYAQRSRLSKTDMLTLAALQPLGNNFTFYNPLGYNEVIDSDYLYQRSKMLRCPEGAKITFDFQYMNKPNKENIGEYTYNDFIITAKVKIVNLDNHQTQFDKIINIEEEDDWTTLTIPEITLPQGAYIVFLTLQGDVKENSSNKKKETLRKLLYAPNLYLHLKKAIINGESKHIPSEFGDKRRFNTFILL